jgi:hypothetical protein
MAGKRYAPETAAHKHSAAVVGHVLVSNATDHITGAQLGLGMPAFWANIPSPQWNQAIQ